MHYFLKDSCYDLYYEYKMCLSEAYGLLDTLRPTPCKRLRKRWDACQYEREKEI